MTDILYVEINVFGILVLAVLLVSVLHGKERRFFHDQSLFLYILITNIILLVFDSLMWVLDGKVFPGARALNIFSSYAYYLFQPIISLLWFAYTYFKVDPKGAKSKKYYYLAAVPVLAYFLLMIINIWTGTVFTISPENIYRRGVGVWALFVICGLYFIGCWILVAFDDKRVERKFTDISYRYLFAIPVFPLVAAIVQLFFYGLSFIWQSTVISCLLIYITLQNTRIYTDMLTNVNNRRHLLDYLSRQITDFNENKTLYVIILDIDNFKKINDTFGHLEGDSILKSVAEILVSACDKRSEMIARFGGDEFIVVGKDGAVKACDTIKKIENNIAEFNKGRKDELKLSCSFGDSYYSVGMTIDALIDAADKKMYIEKQKHHLECEKSNNGAKN